MLVVVDDVINSISMLLREKGVGMTAGCRIQERKRRRPMWLSLHSKIWWGMESVRFRGYREFSLIAVQIVIELLDLPDINSD